MGNKYKCDRCGKLLTKKEYEKSERSVTGFHDFCKNCLKGWIKLRDKQEKEMVEFMNQKDKTPKQKEIKK